MAMCGDTAQESDSETKMKSNSAMTSAYDARIVDSGAVMPQQGRTSRAVYLLERKANPNFQPVHS